MINLVQLEEGKSAKVVSIEGGASLKRRLENLGIREKATIKKVAGIFSAGPVVVKVGSTQVALGKGMALKVIVE